MNLRVVHAFVLRYLFLYTRNWIRVLELIFWPTMELMIWGSLTIFLQTEAGAQIPEVIPWLIGGIILWDVLFRAQQAVAISFLEDVWTRNLLNVFVAPVRPAEYVTAGMIVGVLRTAVTVTLLAVLAAINYKFNLLQLNFAILPYFANLLLFGWSLGMISSALILRWGQAAESLAWAVPFLIQPAVAVVYPLKVLPQWAQAIGNCLPATHIFEGMRAVLKGGALHWGQVGAAFALNIVWLAFAGWIYAMVIRSGRKRGLLTRFSSH